MQAIVGRRLLRLSVGLAATWAALPLWAQDLDPRPLGSPRTISAPGSYKLVADIAQDLNEAAITVSASGVSLDLNGHQIKGPGGKQGIGIRIAGARGVSVRNGAIADSAFGVIVENSSNVMLTDLRIRGLALPVVTAPPEIGVMIVNSRNVVVQGNGIHNVGLGIFVRGGMSSGNRVAGNTVSTSANGVFGICYNPADSGTGGPRGDVIQNNLITGFDVSIQVSAGSAANVFRDNTLAYVTSAYVSANQTNLDLNNSKVQLP